MAERNGNAELHCSPFEFHVPFPVLTEQRDERGGGTNPKFPKNGKKALSFSLPSCASPPPPPPLCSMSRKLAEKACGESGPWGAAGENVVESVKVSARHLTPAMAHCSYGLFWGDLFECG